MGAIIESIASAYGVGSVSCAVRAAKKALRLAARRPNEVGLLIHCGIYPDGFIVEPANAAFIQRRIGANPRWNDSSSTLSFDLNGGGCGFLQAIEVADGFLATGDVDCVLVVASDADPARGESQGFPFRAAGSAVVLARGAEDAGFAPCRTRSFPAFADRYSGRAEFQGSGALSPRELRRGAYRVAIQEKADFAARGVECAEPVLRELLLEPGFAAPKRLIASPHPDGFATGLAARLDFEAPAQSSGASCDQHTAGIGIALEAVSQDAEFAVGDRLLFAALGGGLSVAATVYRVPERGMPVVAEPRKR